MKIQRNKIDSNTKSVSGKEEQVTSTTEATFIKLSRIKQCWAKILCCAEIAEQCISRNTLWYFG